MLMLFKKNKYKSLVIKVLQGEASPAEQRIADEWIAQNPENKKLFESYKALLLLTRPRKHHFDTDKAWEKLNARIHDASQKPGRGREKSNKRRIVMMSAAAVSGIAAMLLIALALFQLNKPVAEMKQFVAANQGIETLELPDGTNVVLNLGAQVNYPERFTSETREITIFGEAFFEVSHNAEKPFIIHAGGLDVKVVGTSFNVEANPDADHVKVTVNTGKVLVYRTGEAADETIEGNHLLTAGEMATFSKENGYILKGVNDNPNFLSWKTGILIFRESRLADVLKTLENRYKTKFIAPEQEVLNQRLTARFENESLEEVLETLSLIFNLKFEVGQEEVKVLPQ